jgi:RNA polymerase sigma-70 factor (ECF subfamily)
MPSPSDALPDAELLARAAQGDREAVSRLYRRHAPRLTALASRILGSDSEAQDLLHDVFLEAWRAAESYSPERGTVEVWLSLRTRSRALDRLKSAGRRSSPKNSERPGDAGPVDRAGPEGTLDQARLRSMLCELPEIQAEVLYLGYFEGLTCAEIAERLQVPIGTIKSRTRLAITRLRDALAAPKDPSEETTHVARR